MPWPPTSRQIAAAERRLRKEGFARATDQDDVSDRERFERADILLGDGSRDVWVKLRRDAIRNQGGE